MNTNSNPYSRKQITARYLRRLSAHPGGGARGAEAASAEAMSSDRVDEALDRLVRRIERESGKAIDPASRAELGRLLREDGRRAIELLKSQGLDAELTPRHQDALEAIVEADGSRPTLAVLADDRVDVADEALGMWQEVTAKYAEPISRVASAVGRIDLGGQHQGTGFVVREGVVLTNRHVLQLLARPTGPGSWQFLGDATITFDAAPDESQARQFRIRKAIRTGPQEIDPESVDYGKLDFALLQCEVPAGGAFPAPLSLESDPAKVLKGRPVFTVGYPAKPPYEVYDSEVLRKLFAYRYGVKRYAPGEIDRGYGTQGAGTGETVFVHDATTLGGSSGSCVVDLGNDGRLVVGLHFAGVARKENYAHASAKLQATFDGLGLDWRAWVAGGAS